MVTLDDFLLHPEESQRLVSKGDVKIYHMMIVGGAVS